MIGARLGVPTVSLCTRPVVSLQSAAVLKETCRIRFSQAATAPLRPLKFATLSRKHPQPQPTNKTSLHWT